MPRARIRSAAGAGDDPAMRAVPRRAVPEVGDTGLETGAAGAPSLYLALERRSGVLRFAQIS
jgi:hypothetical protein